MRPAMNVRPRAPTHEPRTAIDVPTGLGLSKSEGRRTSPIAGCRSRHWPDVRRFPVISWCVGPWSTTSRPGRRSRSRPTRTGGRRRVVLAHAETECPVPLLGTRSDELDEQPTTDACAPTRCDDSDRQLRDALINEAMAVVRVRERPEPRCADRPVVFSDDAVVTGSRPPGEVHGVAGIGEHLVAGRCRLVGTPDRGLAEHRRKERHVASTGAAVPNVSRADIGIAISHGASLPDRYPGTTPDNASHHVPDRRFSGVPDPASRDATWRPCWEPSYLRPTLI